VWIGHFGGEEEAEGVVIVDAFITNTDEATTINIENLFLQHRINGRFESFSDIFNKDRKTRGNGRLKSF